MYLYKASKVLAVLGASSCLFLILPAASASADRAPSPGPSYQFGMPFQDFKANYVPHDSTVGGGWNIRDYGTLGSSQPSGTGMVSLTEPWRNDSAQIVFGLEWSTVSDNRGSIANPSWTVGSTSDQAATVQCGQTPWDATPTTVPIHSATGASMPSGQDNFGSPRPVFSFSKQSTDFLVDVNSWQCPYLISITVAVGVYKSGSNVMQWSPAKWSADWYYTGHPYPKVDPAVTMCSMLNTHDTSAVQGCKGVVTDLPVDRYCENPPGINIMDGATFPAFIGFYTDCLWHPRGGFDRNGLISTAMANGPLGQLSYQMSRVTDSFEFGSVCGPLGPPVSSGALSGFALNTCSWAAWGPQLKPVLGWGITIFFGLWALQFLVETVLSVFGGQPKSPVAGDSK